MVAPLDGSRTTAAVDRMPLGEQSAVLPQSSVLRQPTAPVAASRAVKMPVRDPMKTRPPTTVGLASKAGSGAAGTGLGSAWNTQRGVRADALATVMAVSPTTALVWVGPFR